MLKKITNNLGYSGHFNGIEDAIFSMTKGVKFIEKHFTIDNHLPGIDNKFAILPKQMKDLSDFRYKFEKMDIDTQMKKRRIRSEPEDDDWFGSDYSCCFCIPIALGVKLIGVWWVVNFAALVW